MDLCKQTTHSIIFSGQYQQDPSDLSRAMGVNQEKVSLGADDSFATDSIGDLEV